MSGVWRGKRKYYQAWWLDADGNRRQGSTHKVTKKEAIIWLRKRELAASVRSLPRFPVGRALELAGQKQVRKNQPETVRAAGSRAEHIARLWGEGTDLHDFDDVDAINAFLVENANTYLETRRKEKTPQGRPVSEEQIRKESGLFKQGLRLAVKLGEFKGDPRLVMPEDLGPCRVRERCPTPEEFWALCGRSTDHRRRWLVLYAHSGADPSELHKIDRTREYIDLRRGKYGAIFLNGGKTAYRKRWVPLSPAAREIVDDLLEVPDEGRHPSRVGMLMPSTWESGSFAKTVHPWCRELGIEPVIVKDLRRFYCTELRKAGVPESDVFKLLGQRDSRMIRRIYDRRDDSAFEYVADALPSEANLRQNNVVPIGIRGESGGIEKGAAGEKP